MKKFSACVRKLFQLGPTCLATASILSLCIFETGCGQVIPSPTTHFIEPVSSEEAQLIKSRLSFRQPIQPDETIRATSDSASTSDSDECHRFIERLPGEFRREWIEVPEDWNQPDSRRIRVFYYTRIPVSFQGQSERIPVLFLNGDPGSDSHASHSLLEIENRTNTGDFVYMDQRGTGCSDPLPLTVDENGFERLHLYGSRSIVRDADAIRVHLFGESTKWKVFGQGYGGVIAHRYLQMLPESLLSVHSYGASIMSDEMQWLQIKDRTQRGRQEEYFATYPGDRQSLERIRASLSEDFCFEDGVSRICGPAVLDAAAALLESRALWEALHRWITAIYPDDQELNTQALDAFVRTFVFGVYSHPGFFGSLIHQREPLSGPLNRRICERIRPELSLRPDDSLYWSVHECRLILALQQPWNPQLDRITEPDRIDFDSIQASLESYPSLRFYLYAGRKDGAVPAETFAEEIHRLQRRVVFREFCRSGHEGYYAEPLIWRDLSNQ